LTGLRGSSLAHPQCAAAATGAALRQSNVAELMTINLLLSVWLGIPTDNTPANYYHCVRTAAARLSAADAALLLMLNDCIIRRAYSYRTSRALDYSVTFAFAHNNRHRASGAIVAVSQ